MKLSISKFGLPAALWVALSSVLVPGIASAQSSSSDGGQQRRGPPPQEAFDACVNLTENDSCTVQTPKGTLNGSCMVTPRDEQLVCAPAR